MSYENIAVETRGRVGVVRLNRPDALNALSAAMIDEICRAAEALDKDDEVGCLVIAGSDRAFAAGADIKEMSEKGMRDAFYEDIGSRSWQRLLDCRKPVIAAVNGYALGGGFELALMCDIVIAGEDAKFGLPEITLGLIPGMGGTQRLPRCVGKAKAMEMCLTGRMMGAAEAERAGLVSRLVADAVVLDEAVKTADAVARLSRPAVYALKEAINRAFEVSLGEGAKFESRLFQGLFATDDRREGMAAFIEKREPRFENR